MANAPSKTVLIVAAALAVGVMAISNSIVQRLDPKVREQLEREAEQKAAAAAAAKATPSPSPSASGAAATTTQGAADSLAAFGEEAVLGDKNAKQEVVVRWRWTPEIQADPGKMMAVVDSVQKAAPGVRVRVVNVDDAPDQQAGVFVKDHMVSPALPDGTMPVAAPAIQSVLKSPE
jgi:hypothetical protein